MMIKKSLLGLLSILFPFSLVSAQNQAWDANSHPEHYFLKIGDVASSLKLLDPPPYPGSVHFDYDEAQYRWGKMMRNTSRGKQAFEDAKIYDGGIERAFSEAFGITISKEQTPEIYTLVSKVVNDAGDLSTREAKEHYMRMRPFMFYGEQSLTPDDEKGLSKNGSYPSGHTAIGWATALVLAEINSDRQDEILRRGYDYGQSRVICGVHYQSDVDAGRIVASAVVARLHADKGFARQMEKAKQEFGRMSKKNKAR